LFVIVAAGWRFISWRQQYAAHSTA